MKVNELLNKINEIANKDIEQRSKLKTYVNLIYEDIVNNNIKLKIEFIDENITNNYVACSIDGSKYEIDLADITLIIAKAVKVKGRKNNKKEIPSQITEDLKIIENYYDKNVISNKSILFMLSLETKLLETCEDCDVIFIDGPIIDPPTYYEEDAEINGIMSLSRFVLYRSLVIRKLIDLNKIIIGIVKNYSHRLLIKELVRQGYSVLRNARENYLISNIIYKYRIEKEEISKPIFLGWINWDSLIEEELIDDLKGISKAYKEYKKNLDDFSIYSCYYQYNITSPISRIDIISKEEPKQDALKYIYDWSIPQAKEITLLNKLADNISEINSQEAKKYATLFNLLRENYLDWNDRLVEVMMKRSQTV